jgi:hypothetical protein
MKTILVKKQYTDDYIYVNAILVGGIDGVFAVWDEWEICEGYDGASSIYHQLVHFASGDDGNWWEICCYDGLWIPAIVSRLQKFC